MSITTEDMEKLANICYWYEEKNFIEAWMKAGASRSLAEHLFAKFIQHDNGLDIAGFYYGLDNENRKRFLKFIKLYKVSEK